MTPSAPSAPRAGRREWTAFAVLLLPLLLVSMDVSVLYFAIPAIGRELAPTSTEQLWIFDVYAFALAGLLMTMGALGDRIGRRRLLLLGALAFGAASVAAAYAQSAGMLIAARALLGIGGATLMPSTVALVRTMFRDDAQRTKAIGIWSAAMAGGIALGSVMGGVLLEHFWWGSVFLVNVPAMLLLLVLGPLLLPESRDPAPGRFDLPSVLLSMAAVLPVVYGLKEFAASGYGPVPALCVAGGAAVGVVFVRRQRGRRDALVSPELFRRRGYRAGVALNCLAMCAMMGSAYFTTQYLQSVLGLGSMEAALWSVAPSLAVGVAAPAATAAATRFGRRPVVTAGFLVAAAGFALLLPADTDSLPVVLAAAAVIGMGVVAVAALVADLAMSEAPVDKAGSAASVMETGQEFGGALGMALLGSLGTAVYRREVEGAAGTAGLPAEALDAARETLGGAAAVARELPGAAGETLLAAAREAFVHGMQAAAAGGMAVLLTGAVLALWWLRGERPRPADDGRPAPADPKAAAV
ncbi:MFS transporter [Streptomyces sp. ODS05-4]|uniref:MFS transporter n=1 Tax=Streptomyces sp. ODS05-4 TaxID=2944939 RepID=UPI00210B8919|nr:MFS transporter [Streptomyces sp. ODS05-4]